MYYVCMYYFKNFKLIHKTMCYYHNIYIIQTKPLVVKHGIDLKLQYIVLLDFHLWLVVALYNL